MTLLALRSRLRWNLSPDCG